MHVPLVFAHRGANSFAPENSMGAFRKALELGCDGIELDVRLTADEQVIVFHDRFTQRMTGIPGKVRKMELEEIRHLLLHQNDFPPEKIPTLTEVLETLGRQLKIIIDIKKEFFARYPIEKKVVEIVEHTGTRENVIFSSFNPFVLKRILEMDGELKVGYIFSNRSSMFLLNGQHVGSLHPRFKLLNPAYLHRLQQRREKLYAWTVDDPREMRRLIRLGIDGIITNRPELFLQILREEQSSTHPDAGETIPTS